MSTPPALWHPQAHMPTTMRERLVVASANGAWLTTEDGQLLLDLPAGLWFANIGHARERMAAAAAQQMTRLETYHLFGIHANRPALNLADRLRELVPMRDASFIFTSGGSDSIDAACKLARRYWQELGQTGKTVVLSRTGGYHGLHGFGTSIAGLDFNRAGYGTDSLIPETARVPLADLAETRRIIEELGPERIAALVAEPVVGTGGVHPPPDGYLPGLQELCREFDILFIADEVVTGFGRTGAWFGSDRWEIQPDLMTMAKGITSGYLPLGAVAVSAQVSAPFMSGADAPIFRHGITYSGHATACAVALENLAVLQEEDLLARVRMLEPILAGAFGSLASSELVQEVRSIGLMAGVQLSPDVPADDVIRGCREGGVLTRLLAGNTLHVCPPFVITPDEIQFAADVMATAITAVGERIAA
ncbi:aminotransferase family protein [Kribbella sp. NPDC054772]